eukprot:Filipodium_phascolosomae@DN5761_c0_g1_i1.p1
MDRSNPAFHNHNYDSTNFPSSSNVDTNPETKAKLETNEKTEYPIKIQPCDEDDKLDINPAAATAPTAVAPCQAPSQAENDSDEAHTAAVAVDREKEEFVRTKSEETRKRDLPIHRPSEGITFEHMSRGFFRRYIAHKKLKTVSPFDSDDALRQAVEHDFFNEWVVDDLGQEIIDHFVGLAAVGTAGGSRSSDSDNGPTQNEQNGNEKNGNERKGNENDNEAAPNDTQEAPD